MTTAASAPGKLMLSGEYAVVVAGAPAVACAVNRRLRVICSKGDGPWLVTSDALGLSGTALSAVPLLEQAVDRFSPPGSGGSITITSELGAGADKPGLGSSAALVVAASAALSREFERDTPSLSALIACHQAGQGGGSGYDVATALLGGVCLFQKRGDEAHASSLSWPAGLVVRVLQFERGVSSSSQLRKLENAMAQAPDVVGHALDQQCAAAVAVVAALEEGGELLDVLAHHERTLNALDSVASLGIVTPAYEGVAAALGDKGALLRTAGAGAGDSAWVMARTDAELKPALAALVEAGYRLLDVQVGGRGLEIEEGLS